MDYPVQLNQRWRWGLEAFRDLEEEIGVVKSKAYLDGGPDSRKAKYIFNQLGRITKTLWHSCLAACTSRRWVLLFTAGSNSSLYLWLLKIQTKDPEGHLVKLCARRKLILQFPKP